MSDFRFGDIGISEQQVVDLYKAMEASQLAGQQTWNTGTTGASLKYESLDATIKYLAGELEQMKLYRDLPKKKIRNTVHEFNQQQRFSTMRSAGLNEGEVPYVNNSEYIRRVATTKYIGELRQVTDIMLQVDTVAGSGEELVRQQVEDGVKALTERLNYITARGNSKVVPTEFDGFGELHFNGVYGSTPTPAQYFDTKQNRSLVDMRGGYLTETALYDGSTSLVQVGKGSGQNMRIYAPSTVFTGMVTNLTNTKFVNIGIQQSQTGMIGQAPNGIITQDGNIMFHSDIFLAKNPARYTTDPFTHQNAPLAPITPTLAIASADAGSKFSGFNGNYFYAVSAVNRFGESALLPINPLAVQAVLATDSVDLGWVDGGGTGLQTTTGFVIYRSEVNPTGGIATVPLYPLFEVSMSEKASGYDGGGAGLVRDRNRIIPNTEEAWLFQWDKNTLEFAELFGMRKLDLPYGFNNFMGRSVAILNYGMPLLYAPKRVIRYINVRKNAS